MCLLVAEHALDLLRIAAEPCADLTAATRPPTRIDAVTPEAPCGIGFCDVLIGTDGRSRAWFVEVKTDRENASAGDIIRQLRWYSAQRRGFDAKELVLVVETLPEPKPWMLLQRAGVRVVPAYMIDPTFRQVGATGASSGPITSSASNTESERA